MRRSRRNREQLTVSLFPFLAVLICTLGVLVIMLVMAAKDADIEARKVREDDQEKQLAKIAALELELNTKLVQVEGLELIRPQATKRLEQIRNHRGYLENEIRKLDQQAIQLAAQLQQVNQKAEQPRESIAYDREIDLLKSQIEEARKQLNGVRQAAAEFQPVAYSIVPQPGPGGTNRRPIYLECTGKGVVIQPLGVTLKSSSFVEPVEPGNPLDVALLVIREYWKKYDLAGDAGNPYPLLVIRPSGAQSYVVARRAMKSWDDEFGYEIVEEEKILDFGKVDEQLKADVESAIAEAQRRQSLRAVAAMERRALLRESMNRGSGHRPGLVASGQLGGFVSEGGQTTDTQFADENQPSRSATKSPPNSRPPFKSALDLYRDSSRSGARSSPAIAAKQDNSNPQANSQGQGNVPGSEGQQGNSKISSRKQSIATERGQGWALPSQTPGATGYLRPVRIICAAHQLGVRTAPDSLITIPINDSIENAIEDLIEVVWQLIEGWGSAGDNGYWKPELRITVQPGGRHQFEQLKTLLRQSGLEIKEFAE